MENASKALLMAGGVLIAILIIALLVRSLTSISSFQKMRLTEEEQAQITQFNEQYTKYLGKYVYGTDVLTLKNKYNHDNLVEVKFTEGSDENPGEHDNHYQYQYNEVTGIGSYSNETKYYKCTAIGYDNSTGRVNSITFEQITTSATVEEE